jgi:hypothetical protein
MAAYRRPELPAIMKYVIVSPSELGNYTIAEMR